MQQEDKRESGQVTWQFVGYDNQKQRFFEIRLDNMDTGVLRTEGTISANGKVITNYSHRTDPMTGKVSKLRTVTTLLDQDHYTLEWYQRGEDGKEEKVVTMVCTGAKTAS